MLHKTKSTPDYSYRAACRELKTINGKRYRKFIFLFPLTVYMAMMTSFILSWVITALITGNTQWVPMLVLPMAILPPFVVFELLCTIFSPRRNVVLTDEGIRYAAHKPHNGKWAIAHTKWEDITAIKLVSRGGYKRSKFVLEINTVESYWEPDYKQEIDAPNFKLIHDIKKSHPEIPVTVNDQKWVIIFVSAVSIIGGIAMGIVIK